MTSTTVHPSKFPGDVIAGLVNNVMATAVAGAAVREAVRRGARVRFLQVLPEGLSTEDHANVASVLFKVALQSLHGAHRLPCTFETVVGLAPETLVERSRHAALLVVGADDQDASVKVAGYCEEHGECDVLVVAEPLESRFVAQESGAR